MIENFVLAYDSAKDVIHIVHRASWKSVIPPIKLQGAFVKVKHKWSIIVLITARDGDGQLQVSSRQVITPAKTRKASLSPYLAKLHSEVVDDVRYNHPHWVIEDATWLADPMGRDWTEEDIANAIR